MRKSSKLPEDSAVLPKVIETNWSDKQFHSELLKRWTNEKSKSGHIKVGFPTIDELIKFYLGNYVLFISKPKTGKSTFLRSLCFGILSHNHNDDDESLYIVYITTEESDELCRSNHVTTATGFNKSNLRDRTFTEESKEYLVNAVTGMGNRFNNNEMLTKYFSEGTPVSEIDSWLKTLPRKPNVIVVDYLNKLSSKSNGNETENMTKVSHELFSLATNWNALVITAAQAAEESKSPNKRNNIYGAKAILHSVTHSFALEDTGDYFTEEYSSPEHPIGWKKEFEEKIVNGNYTSYKDREKTFKDTKLEMTCICSRFGGGESSFEIRNRANIGLMVEVPKQIQKTR